MLIDEAERRRLAHAKADMIDAVAFGYGGVKGGKDGSRAMQRLLDDLRRD